MPVILKFARQQIDQIGLQVGHLLRAQAGVVAADQLYEKSDRSRNFVLHDSEATVVTISKITRRKSSDDEDVVGDDDDWPAKVAGYG